MPLIRIKEVETTKDTKNTLLPEGSYEAFVEDYTMDNDEKGSLTLVVRDDVEQDYAKRKMWVNLNASPTIAWKLSTIARAAGIPAGTDYNTFEDYMKALTGKSMKVIVAHREYNGKTYVDVKGFYPTRLAPYKVIVDNDDLII
jgi:hypothetical protein